MSKTLTAPVTGPLTVAIHADGLDVEVAASNDITTARIELKGPDDLLKEARAEMNGPEQWDVILPEIPGGDGTTIIQSGGSVHISSGRVSRGSVVIGHHQSFSGPVIMTGGRGRVIVDGVDVTEAVRSGDGAVSSEAPRAKLLVPAGSSLDLKTGDGDIVVTGALNSVQAETQSGDISVASSKVLNARSMSGNITAEGTSLAHVKTMSGNVNLQGASGATTAKSMSGSITVHALASINVQAESMSGNVNTTSAAGCRPVVDARSMSGRVRTS